MKWQNSHFGVDMESEYGYQRNRLRRLNDSRPYNVISYLDQREIFRKNLIPPLKAVCSLSSLDLYITLKKKPILKNRTFFFPGRRGGFLGISRDGSSLIGLTITPHDHSAMLKFFDLSPEYAIERNILFLHDFPRFGVVRTYFPPNGRFIPTLIFNHADVMNGLQHSGSFSAAMRVDVLVPQVSVHISLSSSALAVCRMHDGKRLIKSYLSVHEDGFVLNTGVAVISVLITKTCVTESLYGQSWQIMRTSNSEGVQALNKVLLDLGETISVASTRRLPNNDSTNKLDNYFSLVPIKKENVWKESGLRHPLFVFRQSVSVEKIVDHVIEKRLRTDWQFRGAIYRGIIDYESDVSYIQSGMCRLIVLCVCEVQLLLLNNACRNDFFLFRFECDWKLNTGVVSCCSCTVLKKINYQEAYKPHMWYPYPRFPVEESDATYFIHNYPMFTGKNLDRLSTPSGGMELACDEFTNNSEF